MARHQLFGERIEAHPVPYSLMSSPGTLQGCRIVAIAFQKIVDPIRFFFAGSHDVVVDSLSLRTCVLVFDESKVDMKRPVRNGSVRQTMKIAANGVFSERASHSSQR